jgi:arylsulfatase A-like enzyme
MKARFSAALALLTALGLACAGVAGAQAPAPAAKPNVLFIVIDDLNDWVGYLGGNPQSPTPNLDRLAKRGVRFTNAHAAVTVCNPSRAAFLSGMRPSTTGVYDNSIDWRPLIPEPKMLTAQFRNAGYWVAGAGKVHHHHRQSDWDEFVKSKDGFQRRPGDTMHTSSVNDVADDAMADHRNVTWLIEQLQKKRDQPLFLAAGLTKPHLPWNVPREYYDRFPVDKIELPPNLPTDLDDLPPAGVHMARTTVQGDRPESDHDVVLRTGRWKETIQGYLAAIAFMDGQIGRLIDALDQSPIKDNTIVVLWSDHGWHLGEKLHWRKQTLWEEATRVPFLWVAPGVTKPDTVCERTVDLMSLYPTLMELAGIPTPEHVEGQSIRRLLVDPAGEWRQPALTTYLFDNHSLRTERWRYIRYADGGEELYDQVRDPQEWNNLAADPDYAKIKAKFARYLPKTNAPPGTKMEGASGDG